MGQYSDLLNRLQLFRSKVPIRYQFEPDALPGQLLPWLLRKPKTLAYLQALLMPAAELYERFLTYTLYARRELSYNGQTLLLERALNDRFDPGLRRIRIINSDFSANPFYTNYGREQQPPKYLYLGDEGRPPRYLYTRAETINSIGFIVRTPAGLAGQEVALHTRIKQLKIALVKYRIVYV